LAGLLLCAIISGCATSRATVEKRLMHDRNSAGRNAGVAEQYQIRCPDVLQVRFFGRPEISDNYKVGLTGCIELGDYGPVRVEGRALPEAARLIAEETGVSVDDVGVRVAEYRSQYLLLFGEVIGWQRSVPYQGPETVLDLLQRVGGITHGAEPQKVYVVRAHVGDTQRPEVLHVDLRAIVVKKDDRTNIRLVPFDQIYVGETRQARVEKSFPPWLRPLYEALWNMLPDPLRQPAAEPGPGSRWISGE
jgi:protein involved in polysaccharide export with SLBB domain